MRFFKLREKHFPSGSSKHISIVNSVVLNSGIRGIKEGDVILSCVEHGDVCIIKKREKNTIIACFECSTYQCAAFMTFWKLVVERL